MLALYAPVPKIAMNLPRRMSHKVKVKESAINSALLQSAERGSTADAAKVAAEEEQARIAAEQAKKAEEQATRAEEARRQKEAQVAARKAKRQQEMAEFVAGEQAQTGIR